MKRCENKAVLLVGGASEVLLTSARMLQAEGAQVAVADTDSSKVRKIAEELGSGACGIELDVTDERSWSAAVQTVIGAFGHWNVLVNCAGYFCRGSVESLSLDDWNKISKTNIGGTWRGCRIGVRNFKAKGGSIINVASVSGIVAGTDSCAYDMACGAVRLLTKSVASYCIDRGYRIRCNSVHPDVKAAAFYHRALPGPGGEEAPLVVSDVGRGRAMPVTAADIAHMIVYLASDESAAVTGAELLLDGGRTAK